MISIHALREEGDYQFCIDLRDDGGFLSTPSARRATPPLPPRCRTWKNFYPRPPRGGRQVDRSGRVVTRVFLSTPSARRATLQCLVTWSSHRYFYPRPPRGGRLVLVWSRNSSEGFLSTPSARRATTSRRCSISGHRNFYPRPPRGGRRFVSGRMVLRFFISIHALREEGDSGFLAAIAAGIAISIHALREEGDCSAKPSVHPGHQFLSTPSARRATAKTETKSLFSNKLYNILHEFRRALIYNGSKNYPNHAK